MKDFKARLSRLERVLLDTEKGEGRFRVRITDRNVRSVPEDETIEAERPAYPLKKVVQICDLYIAGEILTPELLIREGIYQRKHPYTYLFAIVRAIVDGP